MKRSLLPLLATLACVAAPAAPAHATDCLCTDTFTAGDRVVLLVDDPDGATNLPAGSVGTVVCTTGIEARVLVTWDDWTEGHDSLGFCQCPDLPPGGISDSHWWIGCDEGAVSLPPATVTNVTQATTHATLQDALNNANSGDAIEIAAGTLQEDGISFPVSLDVTITGAGIDQTFIDGSGSNPFPIISMIQTSQTRATVIADLTFRNGNSLLTIGGGAVALQEVGVYFRNVRFLDNSAFPTVFAGAHVGARESRPVFERCQFIGGSNALSAVSIETSTDVRFVHCLIADNASPVALRASWALGTLVNCTIVPNGPTAIDAAVPALEVSNSVTVGAVSGATMRHTLFPGAPASDGNIDGVPTFVDASNGDYRLAAGSLGIDAADIDTYLARSSDVTDLAGDDRTVDDIAVADSGIGTLSFLDMGAFERQAESTAPACPTDLDGNGDTGFADLVALLAAWGSCP